MEMEDTAETVMGNTMEAEPLVTMRGVGDGDGDGEADGAMAMAMVVETEEMGEMEEAEGMMAEGVAGADRISRCPT